MPRNTHLTQSTSTPSKAQIWLGLYTATRPHAQTHVQNARLKARVGEIKESLAFIRWRIEIRRQLVELMTTDGKYCITCSRSKAVPYCSASCPLRRQGILWYTQDKAWVYFATKDVALFEKLENDVNKHGGDADKRTIVEWEVTTEDLIKRTQDSPQRYGLIMMRHKFRGFDKDWTFESHWGKGPGIEAEIAPDEVAPNENGHPDKNRKDVDGKQQAETRPTFVPLFDPLKEDALS